MAKKIQEPHIDRTAFSIGSLKDESEEIAYWLARTPNERLAAVEQIRQIVYGYDPEMARIEKVIEIVSLKDLK